MKKLLSILTFIYLSVFICAPIYAQSWNDYVGMLRHQALAEGIRPEVFDEAFQGIHEPHKQVQYLDRSQPENRVSFIKYRQSHADPYRIQLGRKEYKRHAELLNSINKDYGVSACFIVSIWGLETSYGRYMGNFPVIRSLATLGYENRRSAMFRNELMIALHILNDGHVTLEKFKGEWAGGSGQPQFLPSSWKKYAVDYDGDGKKDIWNSTDDSLASIANYLSLNGWNNEEPWAIEVQIPSDLNQDLLSLNKTKSVDEWRALGIEPLDGHLPNGHLMASVIYPDGGPALMVFNNFKVLMKWNYSSYYAGTVGYMAEQICN